MKKLILICCIFCSFASTYAYNNLYITDPQGWRNYQAQIDSAEMSVRHLGAFVEYQMTLSISGVDTENLNSTTQLEIVMDFELPSKTLVTDSWLWIEGKPKQADILDRWTASSIYEEIVSRRKDPSLLVKNGENQYRISIYPMKPQESRVIKITYLSPANYINNNLKVDFPTHIFNLSNHKLPSFKTFILPSEFSETPNSNNTEVQFETMDHPIHGDCFYTEITKDNFASHDIQIKLKDITELKVSKYGDENEGYYNMSFIPAQLIELDEKEKHICFLVDFDKNYTNLQIDNLLALLKKHIRANLTENDYFNIIYSNLSPNTTFSAWTNATNENLDSAFNNPVITDYSNLIPAVVKGIEFINEKEFGSLVIISNNCSYNNIDGSNAIINDLTTLNTNERSISAINYSNEYYTYVSTPSSVYYNNDYLFTNLVRKNNGEFVSLYSNYQYNFENFEYAIELTTNKRIEKLDIYTKSDDGFCYGRINFSNTFNGSYSYGNSIYHFGRYSDGMPNLFEFSVVINGELHHYETKIEAASIQESDSTLKTIYNGLDIGTLEVQQRTNQTVNEIINKSIDNRILSYYTAFLCVEDFVEDCDDCGDMEENDTTGDFDGPVSVDENEKNKYKIFPNPFTNILNIEIENPDDLMEIEVLDLSGRLIKTISTEIGLSSYTWDTSTEAEIDAGIYLIRMVYQNKVITKKVVKL